MADQEVMELTYGLLWRAPIDNATQNGRLVTMARLILMDKLGRDGQARGIRKALDLHIKSRGADK